jgi:2-dehydropantoate 2-reductase
VPVPAAVNLLRGITLVAVRVAVFGAGGVGGYFGARLAASGTDVTFVARGAHLVAIRAHGLRVVALDEDFTVRVRATDDAHDIGAVDYVLVAVKSYDTGDVGRRLAPLLADDTVVVSLQNGIDNEEKLAALVGAEHVAGGVAYIFAHVAEPGVVRRTAEPRSLVFGELDGRPSERLERLRAACEAAGFEATVSAQIQRALWDKAALVGPMAAVTAAARLPIASLLTVKESKELYLTVVAEFAAVARAAGVDLGAGVVEQKLAFAEVLGPDARNSLHNDLEGGRRLELDALVGAVVRRARRHSVPVPATEAVYALLRPWEQRAGGAP